ncbi:uncharacterized protein RAG0_13918 [Rhynchosporium agropyri]|uniref:Uncharacterized protein n=1 Tax=Rhynchosporium agropyri TaxID=914238 RepID=A0A1E1LET7_9HELO|nr:uncharacterized protein RAG0_13918 [Rhynchosporium agropyri]
MQPTGLIPAVVLGLSTLTAALPALEIRAWGNGRECTSPTMCSSGVCKFDQSSSTQFRCSGSGNFGGTLP